MFKRIIRRALILIDHVLQIKNIVFTAYALASREGSRVAMSHLEVAIATGKDFEWVMLAICNLMCSCILLLAPHELFYLYAHILYSG